MKFLLLTRTNRWCCCWTAYFVLAALLTGCGREKIKVYKVPKETVKASESTGEASHESHAGQPHLDWTLPTGWTEQPPSKMRVASFSVAGKDGQAADVAVVPLPGIVGKEVDVVNLWREQVRLSPIDEEEAKRDFEQIEIGSAKGKLFEMVSREPLNDEKSATRILVATFVRDNTSWFFKMTGADSLVSEQKPVFLQFLNSISFHDHGTPNASTSGTVTLESNAKEAPRAANGSGKNDWAAPPTWREVPPTAMLLAKFLATGDAGAKAEITISFLSGAGGGVLANVNRWRVQQLGLSAASEADLPKLITSLDVTSGKAMLVDMTGNKSSDGKRTRLLGAIVPQAGRTWFYKMMGDEPVVAREKVAFIKFVQTVKSPDVP